jgi:hypothetical protein
MPEPEEPEDPEPPQPTRPQAITRARTHARTRMKCFFMVFLLVLRSQALYFFKLYPQAAFRLY